MAFDKVILAQIGNKYNKEIATLVKTNLPVKLKDLKERLEQEGLVLGAESDYLFSIAGYCIEISANIPTFPRFIDDTKPDDEIKYELTRESGENVIRKLVHPRW